MPVPARAELTRRLMPKMVLLIPTVVTITLAAGWQLGVHLGTVDSSYALHGWIVASYIVVGVMAVIALLAGSALLLAVNLFLLARVRGFAWRRFFAVARWALFAYVTIAALIEYAFLRNHLHGGALVVLTLSLVVFALHVPTLIGFTVARFAEPEGPANARA